MDLKEQLIRGSRQQPSTSSLPAGAKPSSNSLAKNARDAFDGFTDLVFPQMKTLRLLQDDASKQNKPDDYNSHLIRMEHQSSLPLQQLLYFNAYYAPFWLLATVTILIAKYDRIVLLHQIISIAVLVVMSIVEVTRLLLGYVGNLMEKVPELAGFFLLTCFLQMPMCILTIVNNGARIQPVEWFCSIVLGVFILAELLFGFLTIRQMIQSQVKRFHLQHMADVPSSSSSSPLAAVPAVASTDESSSARPLASFQNPAFDNVLDPSSSYVKKTV